MQFPTHVWIQWNRHKPPNISKHMFPHFQWTFTKTWPSHSILYQLENLFLALFGTICLADVWISQPAMADFLKVTCGFPIQCNSLHSMVLQCGASKISQLAYNKVYNMVYGSYDFYWMGLPGRHVVATWPPGLQTHLPQNLWILLETHPWGI